ncbi:MAG: zinc ribbon domain-containing protein [Roseburia sp.]|nr:zinc ribbon domain-containing protein [Roseburia sp.]
MDNLKELIKKVRLPDGSDKEGNIKEITKELEEKRNETAKIYGFIGMEVYDLSKAGKIEIAQINNYLEKMDALNQEIAELEKKKEELEVKNAGKNVCTCGYKLKPQDRFCPNCGEVIARAATVCVCGAKLKKNMKFCNVCGRSVEEIQKAMEAGQEEEKPVRECICGAKVPEGQFMCFECGRKIE